MAGGDADDVDALARSSRPAAQRPAPRRPRRRLPFRFNGEIDEVLAALGDGSLDAGGVVTHEFAAEDALEAFEVARDSSASGKVLLRF